ncbi:MAG: hypothetical protein BA861_07205 [Desulfobacterales bacterium S3730MH5]|nr:MAG: hypothetical protein BA861_07205 [Desulfobacterales bacterium S3730MH5]
MRAILWTESACRIVVCQGKKYATKGSGQRMKKCVDCGTSFYTFRRCVVCGKEVKAGTGKFWNFFVLCDRCSLSIQRGLDLKEYRSKKKQRMKRCAHCIDEKDQHDG